MIALTSRPARGRSSDCRGHLGRNTTILPVIKLLIRLWRADFGSSFKESPARLPFLHAANASLSNPRRLKSKVRNHCWSYDTDSGLMWSSTLLFSTSAKPKQENHHRTGQQPAGNHPAPLFTLASAGNRAPLRARAISWWLRERWLTIPRSVFAKQSGFIFGEGDGVWWEWKC